MNIDESEQERRVIEEWAERHGSNRLRLALKAGELPRRLYLEERGRTELPGFELDFEGSMQTTAYPDPDDVAAEALDVVIEYLGFAEIAYAECEVVRRKTEYDDRPAIVIRGWEGGVSAVGYVADPGGSPSIVDGYPQGVASKGDPPLRPTAYGSAYGLRHPAAQEALRAAAIVSIDEFGDMGTEELEEFLPPDAHDLIDDDLVRHFADTLQLVGWKFGQPRQLMLSSLAEQIAGFMLIRRAELMLEDGSEVLSSSGMAQAREELDDFEQMVMDEDFRHEYLPSVEAHELAAMVPSGVPSRRASLWAPWHAEDGEPSPRITGDDEPEWSLTETPGLTPREKVAVDREVRDEEQEERRGSLRTELAELPWRLEFHRDDPYLLADTAAGGIACVFPPPALHGARRVSSWAWVYSRYPDREAAFDFDAEPEGREMFDWPAFFQVFPSQLHPLAVDAVFSTIEVAMEWVAAVGGHALPAGAVAPFEQTAKALEGIVAMREQLERCRKAGLVQDDRLTRYGVRHELFGSGDLRFIAEARFAPPLGYDFDRVQGDFNQAIYDFSPLPISLGIEPHEEGDDSLIVRCAMGVESVDEAHDLADEVISQILWRVGLRPIDLHEGAEVEEIGFVITDLEEEEAQPED